MIAIPRPAASGPSRQDSAPEVMPPPLDSKAICVRVSRKQYAEMQACAERHGINVPELLRRSFYLYELQEMCNA